MKDTYDKWWSRLQFTLFFLVLTVVVHGLFGWFHGWLKPQDPYKEPEGRAAKVFHSGTGDDPETSPGDRLRLFYWYGE
ncbi:DUF4227 family protein [Cohnella candidum]|uniref:DUF4227 family protein n=1 Tax=Cohnella candidum TaxID=2674991 RepID=A0A3G3JX44_9BACL|nr:DUF4227 family protein [Cohnella candidum]AYQ72785.1 DUF4227 family protein [Cohnella candidum]